jgi:hypothetical protein
MQRLREIHDEISVHTVRLGRAYAELREAYREDGELFERRWRAIAARWDFRYVNELIAQHNDYYPIEAQLALDPRTGEYVKRGGRSYRREPLSAAWVLERFPVSAGGPG